MTRLILDTCAVIDLITSSDATELKQYATILTGSPDAYGMNQRLVDTEEVTEGW